MAVLVVRNQALLILARPLSRYPDEMINERFKTAAEAFRAGQVSGQQDAINRLVLMPAIHSEAC